MCWMCFVWVTASCMQTPPKLATFFEITPIHHVGGLCYMPHRIAEETIRSASLQQIGPLQESGSFGGIINGIVVRVCDYTFPDNVNVDLLAAYITYATTSYNKSWIIVDLIDASVRCLNRIIGGAINVATNPPAPTRICFDICSRKRNTKMCGVCSDLCAVIVCIMGAINHRFCVRFITIYHIFFIDLHND